MASTSNNNAGVAAKQLPNKVKQEIHYMLGVHCRELLMAKRGGGAKVQEQDKFMEKVFFGSDSHQSVLDLFLEGKAPYDKCFDFLELTSNREGNESRENGHQLVLKEMLHLVPSTFLSVHENGFDREGLSMFRNKRVTGRKLNDNALEAIRIYKHALAAHKEYLGSVTTDNPSGLRLEDMLWFVRRKLFVKFKGADNPVSARKKTVEVEEDDMPVDYMFKGFLTFAVYGPQPLSKRSLSCLSEDCVDVEKKSRATARAEAATEAATSRATGEGGYVPDAYKGRRGVTLEAKRNVATIVQRDNLSKRKAVTDLLYIETAASKQTLEEIREVRKGLEDAYGVVEPNQGHINKLEKHLDNLYDSLGPSFAYKKKLKQQAQDLLEAETPKEISSFIDQVGDFGREEGSTPASAAVVTTTTTPAANGDTSPNASPDSDSQEPTTTTNNNVIRAATEPALDTDDDLDSD